MDILTREEILSYDEDELKKLKLGAEYNKFTAEQKKAEEDAKYTERNNVENSSLGKHARVYTFYDPVKSVSVAKCMEELGNWTRRDPGENIKIILNSPGGNVLDGLALFDYLKSLRRLGHHIEVMALGMAASMGGVLLQAGDVRSMGRSSWMLIHEVSSGAIGGVSELEDEVEFCKRLQETLLQILTERSTMTKAQVKRKWHKNDWWLSADQALELGFIDKIED